MMFQKVSKISLILVIFVSVQCQTTYKVLGDETLLIDKAYLYHYFDKRNDENNYLGFISAKNFDLMTINSKIEGARIIYIDKFFIENSSLKRNLNKKYLYIDEKIIDSVDTSIFKAYKYEIKGCFIYINSTKFSFNGISNIHYNFRHNGKIILIVGNN